MKQPSLCLSISRTRLRADTFTDQVLKLKRSPKVVFVCAKRVLPTLATRREHSQSVFDEGASYCFTTPPRALAEVAGLHSSQLSDDFAVCCEEEDFA